MKKIMTLILILSIATVAIAAEKAASSEKQAPEKTAVQSTVQKTKAIPAATIQQKQAAEKAGLPLEKNIDLGSDVNMVVVFIPAGEFEMGSPMQEPERDKDESQHHIKLTKPFYMGKFEVTQIQYRTLIGENPSEFGGDKRPVDNVNWYEAMRFLKKISDKTEMKFRLPTEAEWEYACRAGTTTAFNTGTTLD
jgi:formylglycine-generating enzyme required for sulfatase activity